MLKPWKQCFFNDFSHYHRESRFWKKKTFYRGKTTIFKVSTFWKQMLSVRARTLDFIAPVDVFWGFFKIAICDVHTRKYEKRPPKTFPTPFQKLLNSMQNLQKNASKRDFERRWDIKAQKIDKKTKTTPPGLHFGRIWEALGCHLDVLGRLLDAPWASLERSWTSLGHLLGLLGTSWTIFWPLEGFQGWFWKGFGRVWKGFGLQNCRLLGRFRVGLWEGSNNFWEGIWKGLGISISLFGSCLVFPWVSRSFGTPAMSRSASTISAP